MTALRYFACTVALVAFVACGGGTKAPTKPVTDSSPKVDRINPCGSAPANPCGVVVDNPCSGPAVNPCSGNAVNPCSGEEGAIEPSEGNKRNDPSNSPKY